MHPTRLGLSALLAAGALFTACAAEPGAAPPRNAVLDECAPVGAAATAAGGGVTAAGGTDPDEADAVVVAVDADGRPEVVSTDRDEVIATATELNADPDLDVVAIEEETPVSIEATGDPLRSRQWGLDTLRIDQLRPQSTGAGVDVAVVDTGVHAQHADLGSVACSGVAFLGSGPGDPGAGAVDPNGHGTHVAGIVAATHDDGIGVAGVAPNARIIPVRVLDAAGSGSSSNVARGIIWAVDHGAEVVNLSLGGGYSHATAAAVDYAESEGVVVIAAAGNDGVNSTRRYPGALARTVAVAATSRDGNVASYSSRGDYVDVAAPGSSIHSTTRDGAWGPMSGTSMATPHVAGVVALVMSERPELGPAQVRSLIASTADDAGAAGWDSGYGWGVIDPDGLLGA